MSGSRANLARDVLQGALRGTLHGIGLLLLLTASTSSAATAEDNTATTEEDYNALSGSKALAIIPGTVDGHGAEYGQGVAHGQPNDLLASLTALRTCELTRLPDQPACELARLNDEQITSGADIRASLPNEPHPLHLWRIIGPAATIYLAGSVHILKPSLYPLPAPFERAFEASDHLVLEVNVAAHDPQLLQQKTLAYASLANGERIQQVLPEPLLLRLSNSLARYGVPITQVATVNPAFLMNQVVLLRLITLGYQAEYGIEQHFLRKLGQRDVLELETIDAQLALLFDQPMPLQIQLLEDTLDQEAGIEPLITGMVSAWLAGDDARFMEMFELQAGDSELARRFTEQLLDERNASMVERIRALLSDEGTYFVLVGAAHLIGENGIVELLARQGIVSERLSSNSSMETD